MTGEGYLLNEDTELRYCYIRRRLTSECHVYYFFVEYQKYIALANKQIYKMY